VGGLLRLCEGLSGREQPELVPPSSTSSFLLLREKRKREKESRAREKNSWP
jgi:hypothetical protein